MGYRYIGSKEKLASTIIDIIKNDCPNAHSVIDLMAGTGLFSLALRKNGYKVIASDVMSYSYHHLVVNLLLNEPPKFEGLKLEDRQSKYKEVLDILNSRKPIKGYFFKEFSPEGNPTAGCKPRKYFTSENAAKIDAIRDTIKKWHDNRQITDNEHSLLLHDLIMAVNDIANIAGTYGHYLSHFVKRATDPILLTPTTFDRDPNIDHEVRRGYAEELSVGLTGDVCYIDPPYIKRQYAANYHVLETIAREDCPDAIGESGLRPWRDQYSNFCSKVKIRSSFDKILRGLNCNQIYISYSEDGLLSLDDMFTFLSQYGEVKLHQMKYKRFKSNNSKKDPYLTEYLFHLIK